MDTKVFSAYNEESKRVLSPRLIVVDAAREPIKVLKILMEGLAPHARNGIWLVNFKGVPIARAASGFDLVYLDEEDRVLQATEITEQSEFQPFKGQPASALILQPQTIARSKTFTGDRLALDRAEHRSVDPEPAAKSKRAPRVPARVVPDFVARTFNVPSEGGLDARSSTSTGSGRLMRSGSLALSSSPRLRPEMPSVVPQSVEISQEKPDNKVVPISAAAPLPEVERSETQKAPAPRGITPSAPAATSAAADIWLGAKRTIAPTPRELTPIVQVATPATADISTGAKRPIAPTPSELAPIVPVADLSPAVEQPLVTHSFPSTNVTVFEPQEPAVVKRSPAEDEPRVFSKAAEPIPPTQAETRLVREEQRHETSPSAKRSWDVRLLYSLFPELNPSYRPDLEGDYDSGTLSKKVLSWFYPDLDLEAVERKQRSMRRAPRIPEPGLVGYYFAGGPSTPHEVRNISVMGFYMITDQRWMPGTVIRVTLQMLESDGENPCDTITVLSRVVNWGQDGGGFEFVFPGSID